MQRCKNVYVPKFIIESLSREHPISLYQKLLEPLCKKIEYLQLFPKFDCDEWISLEYIVKNKVLIDRIIDSITEEEDYTKSTKILRLFIDLIKKSGLSIKNKFSIRISLNNFNF